MKNPPILSRLNLICHGNQPRKSFLSDLECHLCISECHLCIMLLQSLFQALAHLIYFCILISLRNQSIYIIALCACFILLNICACYFIFLHFFIICYVHAHSDSRVILRITILSTHHKPINLSIPKRTWFESQIALWIETIIKIHHKHLYNNID